MKLTNLDNYFKKLSATLNIEKPHKGLKSCHCEQAIAWIEREAISSHVSFTDEIATSPPLLYPLQTIRNDRLDY
jgi:hypothetical protein